ncbi:MAG: hypothetical protein PHC61_14605, partial [Chitinivibrionales bacterium]|nr:hypothetical protein [Chitinivibrionales bacterium]
IGAAHGGLIVSADKGATWQKQGVRQTSQPQTLSQLYAAGQPDQTWILQGPFFGENENTMAVVCYQGTNGNCMFKSTDAGTSWTALCGWAPNSVQDYLGTSYTTMYEARPYKASYVWEPYHNCVYTSIAFCPTLRAQLSTDPHPVAVIAPRAAVKSFPYQKAGNIINYTLATPAFVSIKYYDMQGKTICSFVNNVQQAGAHSFKLPVTLLPHSIYVQEFKVGDIVKKEQVSVVR